MVTMTSCSAVWKVFTSHCVRKTLATAVVVRDETVWMQT